MNVFQSNFCSSTFPALVSKGENALSLYQIVLPTTLKNNSNKYRPKCGLSISMKWALDLTILLKSDNEAVGPDRIPDILLKTLVAS